MITTVGYGDVVPVTTAGKVIGILLMYSGTVLFIAFVGFLVSFWTEEIVEEEKLQKLILQRLNDIHHRLEALEKRQR